MVYTREGIMAQIWVAFGQGTGTIRVSQEAAWALRELYYDAIDETALSVWESEAVQVLERIRAIGRLAAALAIEQAQITIPKALVLQAAAAVEAASGTSLCPVR
jgi:hypothetical protein